MSRALAWLVHGLTASGAVFAFLALLAIEQRDWRLALLWLAAALAVDAFDGTLARWAHVKQRAPRIDGETLDLIIDYLNYVFVPTVLIWRAELVPPALAPWLAAAILISALYNFARRDMKTEDNYFAASRPCGTSSPSISSSPGPGRGRRGHRRRARRPHLHLRDLRPPLSGSAMTLAAGPRFALGDRHPGPAPARLDPGCTPA